MLVYNFEIKIYNFAKQVYNYEIKIYDFEIKIYNFAMSVYNYEITCKNNLQFINFIFDGKFYENNQYNTINNCFMSLLLLTKIF